MLLTLEITILLLTVCSIYSMWLDSFGLYCNPHFTLGTSHMCSVEFFLILVTPLEPSASVYLACDRFMFQLPWGNGPCVRRRHSSRREAPVCSSAAWWWRMQTEPPSCAAAEASRTGNVTSLSLAPRLLRGRIFWGNFCVMTTVSELN